jgi:hypothetical protein
MNANKRPLWKQAWQMLIQKQYIQVTAAPNRQQFIGVLRIPDYLRPWEVADKARPPRRARQRTAWFNEHLPEFLRRDGYHELADAVEEMNE